MWANGPRKENGYSAKIMKPAYKIMFVFSLVLFVAASAAIAVYGLNFGVDFMGGSVMKIEFGQDRPSADEVQQSLSEMEVFKTGEVNVNLAGDKEVIIRTNALSEQEHQQVLSGLASEFSGSAITEKQFDSIGPTVGRELRNKSLVAILIVLGTIMVYLAFVFRKLSGTLSLWVMNVATVIALLHDIVIPLGVFAILGHFLGVQITAVFVAAILTILGYTVSDKVVIFDRVRENILRGSKEDLGSIVHKSVMQTLVRSINNTLTVMLSSAAIFFFGGESIKYFALALIMGVALGAYSSIFVASPLLVWWNPRRK